jgi:lysophospholipase L1-like esterase
MKLLAQLSCLALPVLFLACSSQKEASPDAAPQTSGGKTAQSGTGGSSLSGSSSAQAPGGSGGASGGGGTGGAGSASLGGSSSSEKAGSSGTGDGGTSKGTQTTSGTGGTSTGGASGSGKGGTTSSGTAGTQATGGAGGTAGNQGSAGTSGSATGGRPGDAGTPEAGAASYNPCAASTGPCKILPLGDSITFGGGSQKVNGTTETFYGGYRVQLFTHAVNANQRITFVGSQSNGPTTVAGKPFPQKHEGHSGWVIDQIVGIIPSPALNDKPDIILLMIGTNDTYGSDPPGAADRLGKLMDKILDADNHALLVVSAIPPWAAQGTKIPTYNNAIPPMVEKRAAAGKHIVFVDATVGWDSKTMFGDDNLHPNWTGYNLMGDLWYKALGGLFPQ